jgi:hypothetical protein
MYALLKPRGSAERQLGEKTSPGLSGLSLTRDVAGGPCLIDAGEKPFDGPAVARIATTTSGTALHVCLEYASPTWVPMNMGKNDVPSGRCRGPQTSHDEMLGVRNTLHHAAEALLRLHLSARGRDLITTRMTMWVILRILLDQRLT